MGAHEVRELEGERVGHAGGLGLFELPEHLLPFDGREAPGHVAVEGLDVGPAGHAVLLGEFGGGGEEAGQFVEFGMAVLEGDDVHEALDGLENLRPVLHVSLHAEELQRRVAGGLADLATREEGRDHHGFPAGDLLGVAGLHHELLGGPGVVAADFVGDIPSCEGLAVTVERLDFVDDLDLHLRVVQTGGLIEFGIEVVPHASACVELQAVLFGEGQEEVDPVHGWLMPEAAVRGNDLGGIGQELVETAADQEDLLDAHRLHCREIRVPLLGTPVVVRNVVGDLIQKRAGDA